MAARPDTTRTLLANARVLTCAAGTDERPSPGHVLIEGDRIAAVSPTPLEVAAHVIDVRGAPILPGLCDAHTHIDWPLNFVLDHAAQSRDHRRERQLPLGELDAFTEQNQRVHRTSTRLELRNQAALPDPRLPGHQQRPAAPRRGASEQPLQRL